MEPATCISAAPFLLFKTLMVRTLSTEYQPKIGLVSLGCPKATSDSEHIITRLRAEGYQLSKDYRGSHAVIVNTCGFLDSARAESLDAIGEAIAENGKVIVTGCLGKDKDVITKTHPKVLEVTGPHAYEEVMSAIRRVVPPKHDPFEHLVPETGLRLTPRHYAYLKISEGCNNRCSFCIIPSLRGNLASRPIHQVLAEATRLKKAGVKELLVISQDTSAYGVDLKYQEYSYRNKAYKTKFRDLCAGLSELDLWVRLHYVYPYPHVDDVLPFMQSGGILPYLDIPFQHFAPDILRKMKRPGKVDKTLDRILKWREAVPDLTIRSTFIVGFPGETEADFALMLDVLEAAEIDRAGCFIYEPVKGAASNDLENHIPPEIQQERYERFMLKQQEISEAKLARKIDTEIDVIIDDFDGENWIGRSKGDAPEIDGHVYLNGDAPLEIGDIVSADIYDADAYDLYGRYIDKIS